MHDIILAKTEKNERVVTRITEMFKISKYMWGGRKKKRKKFLKY